MEDRIEGEKCSLCLSIVSKQEVTDVRQDFEKAKRPLTEEEKTILFCRCNHPGDLYVGGFF
jgi:ferredoxin